MGNGAMIVENGAFEMRILSFLKILTLSWFLVPGTWFSILNTLYSILITKYYKKTSIKYLIYGDKEYFCRPKNALQNGLKLLI